VIPQVSVDDGYRKIMTCQNQFLTKKTILIVDDEPDMLTVVEEVSSSLVLIARLLFST
jgi:hypothetical protein